MSDSAKFVTWLGGKVDEVLAQAAASGDLAFAWSTLSSVDDALEGRISMVFGAVVSSHVPALRSALGPRVNRELARLSAELSAQVVTALARPEAPPTRSPSSPPLEVPAPKGMLGRLGAWIFGSSPPAPPSPPMPGPADEPRALELAKRAGLAIAGLLDHPDPRVRLMAVAGLSHTSAAPRRQVARARLEARLTIEADAPVARELIERLNAAHVALGVATVSAVKKRFPELKPLLLMSRMASPDSMREVVTSAETRLDAVAALADPLTTQHAAVRNELIIEALGDRDVGVSRAALAGVKTWRLRGAADQVRALAMSGRGDALEVLVALAVDDPSLAFDLVIENANRRPPVLTGLAELAATKRKLTKAQDAALEALLPTLPDGPAADAIRHRFARLRPVVGSTASSFDALEAAIDESPDDVNAWLVWSDAMQGVGDPRGELVALAQAGKPVTEALARALPTLAPGLSAVMKKPDELLQHLTLHMGLPRRVVFRVMDEDKGSQAQVVAAVMGAPLGRFVREVHLGLTSEDGESNDWSASLEALGASGVGVRSLLLGAFEYPDEMEISWVNWGDVSAVWTLPRLQHLHLRGGHGELGAMSSATLESLTIETGGLSRADFERVLSAKLPALTSLTLWTGDENYGADTGEDDIVALLDWAPAGLTSLGIENCGFTHQLIDVFAKHRTTKQLRRLSFKNGVLRADEVDLLLSRAEAFRHLERLDLSANLLDDGACERISAAMPNAVVTEQREDYGEDGDRYVAVSE